MVRVKMLGTIKDASGKEEEELILPDETHVARVLQRLTHEYGKRLDEVLLDQMLGSPLPNTLILLNGVEINNLDGLETPVRDGDTLILLPVAHGG